MKKPQMPMASLQSQALAKSRAIATFMGLASVPGPRKIAQRFDNLEDGIENAAEISYFSFFSSVTR